MSQRKTCPENKLATKWGSKLASTECMIVTEVGLDRKDKLSGSKPRKLGKKNSEMVGSEILQLGKLRNAGWIPHDLETDRSGPPGGPFAGCTPSVMWG